MDPIIPQSPEQLSVQPTKHFLSKKFIITFVVLLLLAGGVYAGIWMWQNQQVAQEVVPTFTPRADVTADWQTYTNTKFGFELRYPQNWLAQTFDNDVNLAESEAVVGGTGSVQINISSQSVSEIANKILAEIKTNSLTSKIISDRQVSFVGLNAREIIRTTAISLNRKDFIFNRDSKTFWVVMWNNQVENQILSTFKFTK